MVTYIESIALQISSLLIPHMAEISIYNSDNLQFMPHIVFSIVILSMQPHGSPLLIPSLTANTSCRYSPYCLQRPRALRAVQGIGVHIRVSVPSERDTTQEI